MLLHNYTINKVYPLQQRVTSQGETWHLREIILKDETREFGDTVLCRLHKEKATAFDLPEGCVVDAHADFRTREYTSADGKTRAGMEARCWKIEPVHT